MLSPIDLQIGAALGLLTSGQDGRGAVKPIATDTVPGAKRNSQGAGVFGDTYERGSHLGVRYDS